MSTVNNASTHAIQQPGEENSNQWRRRLAVTEPLALRTYTPSMAILARSSGSYHWTPEGRKLADFTSGVLVANLGHHPRRWWQRVLNYLCLGDIETDAEFLEAVTLTAYNAATEIEIECCERLLGNMRRQPGGDRMEQVLWAASGSEAIQKALWAALAVDSRRDMILATRGGFHGKKGLAGAVTGCEADSGRDPRVRFVSFPKAECGDVDLRRQPLDLEPYQQELNQVGEELGDRVCCLITEPYLGGGGSYHPQPEYLQLLQQFCREHGALLILDEIQANFGRTGPMYAYTQYGVEPDIVCLGKGMGNGVPVSAAVGRADIFAALHYGEGSDTWSANPLASAAVLATLDEFESTDVIERGLQLSAVLEEGLARLKQTGLVERVRGEGCVWGVECAAAGSYEPEEVANACVEACYRGDPQGRAIHLLGPLAGKVLRVSPPLVMPLNEAREYLDAMFDIFSSVRLRLRA
jgi:4-aminobutyrate aminotransferase-like enzyme